MPNTVFTPYRFLNKANNLYGIQICLRLFELETTHPAFVTQQAPPQNEEEQNDPVTPKIENLDGKKKGILSKLDYSNYDPFLEFLTGIHEIAFSYDSEPDLDISLYPEEGSNSSDDGENDKKSDSDEEEKESENRQNSSQTPPPTSTPPPHTSCKMLHSLYISKHKNTVQYKADSMGCRIKHTSNRLSANNSYLLLNIARTHIRQSVLGEKNINPIGKEDMKSVFNLALCNFFAHEIDKAD